MGFQGQMRSQLQGISTHTLIVDKRLEAKDQTGAILRHRRAILRLIDTHDFRAPDLSKRPNDPDILGAIEPVAAQKASRRHLAKIPSSVRINVFQQHTTQRFRRRKARGYESSLPPRHPCGQSGNRANRW